LGVSERAETLRGRASDAVEEVALVARARREMLLRVHSYRLRREDLEDCYSQTVVELVVHVRGGGTFSDRAHLANAIEQRFLSRIHDRRRAISGRSPMQAALENAVPLDGIDSEEMAIADRVDLEQLTIFRHELRVLQRLAGELTDDQRLVLATQVSLQMGSGEFRDIYGWSSEKYRKVAQRGRARLKRLMANEENCVPTREGGRNRK
jgi:DNA-directed RNA polymerase specialized sigma24 family protein